MQEESNKEPAIETEVHAESQKEEHIEAELEEEFEKESAIETEVPEESKKEPPTETFSETASSRKRHTPIVFSPDLKKRKEILEDVSSVSNTNTATITKSTANENITNEGFVRIKAASPPRYFKNNFKLFFK